jgi:benzoyl-CoA reductase/2-hydroxyglutaryl-CoA dehydratase subunit BcrC/BadD/HgdB
MNQLILEKTGAIVAGHDDPWNCTTVQIEEDGDPYYNIAKSILSLPYEQPIEKRAEWTIELIRKSRADGVIFMYNWGCSYQSAVARMITDIIKEKSGIPTAIIEVGELGRVKGTEQSKNRIESFVEML